MTLQKSKVVWLVDGSPNPNLPSRRLRVFAMMPLINSWFDQSHYTMPRTIFQFFKLRKFLKEAQIIILQKELPSFYILWLLKRLKASLVYDFDDAVYIRHVTRLDHGYTLSGKLSRRFSRVCKSVDLIFAGNKILAHVAHINGAKNVMVLPTSVPLPSLAKREGNDSKSELVKLGWVGSKLNLFYLESIENVLLNLQRKNINFKLLVMSDRAPKFKEFSNHEFIQWSPDDELTFLNSIDIGLMPLKNNAYTQGKCAYKALQYMSFGKPVVVSDVGVNAEWINGAGFSVGSNGEMEQALFSLILDSQLRGDFGSRATDLIRNKFERNLLADQLKDALLSLIDQSFKDGTSGVKI